MEMESVSIIIPAYNAETYLKEAVDSALSQTYNEREVIIVDDGSTDRTPRILADYGHSVRVIRQANRGSPAACNAGVAAARGTWISFLDADDVWLPGKLARQIEACRDTGISHTDSVCFGDSLAGEVRRSSFEPPYSGRILKELLVRNFITKSTVMMRRDLFQQYGGFDETFVGVEDWPFWLKVCAEHELGYLPEAVVRYRVHRESKSMKARKMLADHMRIIDWAFGPRGVGESLLQLKRQSLISSYQINSHYAAESGDWTFAAYCAMKVLRHEPASLTAWKRLIKSALIPAGIKY
jgi:glycosyltransferase involved in cell wall biosynthesis